MLKTTKRHQDIAGINVTHDVMKELERACEKHPGWPRDLIYQWAIVQEEVGETQKEVLQFMQETQPHQFYDKRELIRKEAIQAAAMIFRFLAHLDADPISHPILDKP